VQDEKRGSKRERGRGRRWTVTATSFCAFVRAWPDVMRMCVFVVITFKLPPMPHLMPLAGAQIPDVDTSPFPPLI